MQFTDEELRVINWALGFVETHAPNYPYFQEPKEDCRTVKEKIQTHLKESTNGNR